MWYHALLETNVTHLAGIEVHPCRVELKHPEISWSLAATPGLSSQHLTFLWSMAHDLHPTPARLFILRMPNANSVICSHCIIGDLTHSLLLCPYNDGAGQCLIEKLRNHIPNLLSQQVNLLDLDLHADHHLSLVYLVVSVPEVYKVFSFLRT
jgi:hypothetical protein